MKIRGLSTDQTHRLLEDLQTLGMVNKSSKEAIELDDKEHLLSMNALMKQVLDGFGRDVTGMLNGNNKKEKNIE